MTDEVTKAKEAFEAEIRGDPECPNIPVVDPADPYYEIYEASRRLQKMAIDFLFHSESLTDEQRDERLQQLDDLKEEIKQMHKEIPDEFRHPDELSEADINLENLYEEGEQQWPN